MLNLDLYAANCSEDSANVLHFAACFGYTAVVKEVLVHGYYRLLNTAGCPFYDIYFKVFLKPATVAVETTHFATATQLLQAMEPE